MQKPRVYVVDDELPLVELYKECIEEIGLECTGFTSGTSFVEHIVKAEDGSLVLLDLQMPDMDGVEVMRALSNIPNRFAVILVSGHDISVLRSAEKLCRAHGFNILASLSKPIHFGLLAQCIQSYLSSSQESGDGLVSEPVLAETAIDEDRLMLVYQPQIDLTTGRLSGLEALVRCRTADGQLVNPCSLLEDLELHGDTSQLTSWVINEAVAQSGLWLRRGYKLPISINVSATDLNRLDMPEVLDKQLSDAGVDPTDITLEITESALMGELATSLDVLTRLRLKGIGLSIDDFGTGYSSLSQLHRAPFTELKIDRSFVSYMNVDKEAHAIVKTCIMLGHEMEMKVVAEGIENREQLESLKDFECDIGQGFYFSRPAHAKDIPALLGARPGQRPSSRTRGMRLRSVPPAS